MATYTENYNLEKPAQSDLYNIDVFNENADKIDAALGDKAENQSLAPIELSATASRNYSVGQQFVYNGLLYEATAAIASGGTITPGSNCARTTVAEELKSLNDSLEEKIANKQNAKYVGIVNHGTSTTFQVAPSSVSQATLVTAQYGDVAFLYIVSYEGTYAFGDGTGSGLTIKYLNKVITVKNDHASRNYRVSAFGIFA